MKKKLILSYILAAMLTQTVHASSITDIKFDIPTQTFSVSGNADAYDNTDYREVSMRILAPGKTEADCNAMNGFDSSIVEYLAPISPSANGSFTYSYKSDVPQKGDHKIIFTFADGSSISKNLFFTTTAEDNELLSRANAADTKDKMISVFTDYSYLFLGMECYEDAAKFIEESTLKTDIAEKIAGMKFADSGELCDEIKKAAIVAGLEEKDAAEDFKEWLDKWKQDLGIADDTIYTKLYPISSDSVTDELAAVEFKSAKDFYNTFCEKVILDAVNKSINYTDIGYVLDNGAHFLTNADIDRYSKLSDEKKVKVQRLLTGKYNSVNDFEKKIKKRVTAFYFCNFGKIFLKFA